MAIKIRIVPLILGCIMSSCSITKKPEFKQVNAITIEKLSLQNVTLNAEAVFENPNHIGGKLSLDDIHIIVNDIDMGTVSSATFDVPSKSEFTIPITGTFLLSKLYKDNQKGLLENILNTVKAERIDVKYQGEITYHMGKLSYPYKINKSSTISLK